MSDKDVSIGIIGGTGVYDPSMFKEEKNVKVYTPFGEASDLVSISIYERKKIAFLHPSSFNGILIELCEY